MNMFGILRMTLRQKIDCLLVFCGGTNTAKKCFLLKILLVDLNKIPTQFQITSGKGVFCGERFEQS